MNPFENENIVEKLGHLASIITELRHRYDDFEKEALKPLRDATARFDELMEALYIGDNT